MAIPFRNFSFDPTQSEWVLDLSREIRRKNEQSRWSSISAATRPADISRAGTLTGIEGINQGLGLDVQVYGALRYRFDWQEPKHETFSFRASGNAFYKITPQLTGTLTVNPDFSNSPLDRSPVQHHAVQSVPAPRTPRHFFLRTSRRSSSAAEVSPPAGGVPSTSIRPRRKSRSLAQYGFGEWFAREPHRRTKLSETTRASASCALSVVTTAPATPSEARCSRVARITRPIGESKIGLIYTNGDPTGLSKNSIAGADFQFRDSDLLPARFCSPIFSTSAAFGHQGRTTTPLAWPSIPERTWGLDTRFKQAARISFQRWGL